MATTMARRVYWAVFTAAFVVVFSVGLLAQSRSAAATSASSAARDLNSTLAELTRVAPATNQDLGIMRQHGPRLQRVEFWRGDRSHNAQVSEALQRNLQFAVPSLIHDAHPLLFIGVDLALGLKRDVEHDVAHVDHDGRGCVRFR